MPGVARRAKTGGGDGNRTHVRNMSSLKYSMLSFRIYRYFTSKTQIESKDNLVFFLATKLCNLREKVLSLVIRVSTADKHVMLTSVLNYSVIKHKLLLEHQILNFGLNQIKLQEHHF